MLPWLNQQLFRLTVITRDDLNDGKQFVSLSGSAQTQSVVGLQSEENPSTM